MKKFRSREKPRENADLPAVEVELPQEEEEEEQEQEPAEEGGGDLIAVSRSLVQLAKKLVGIASKAVPVYAESESSSASSKEGSSSSSPSARQNRRATISAQSSEVLTVQIRTVTAELASLLGPKELKAMIEGRVEDLLEIVSKIAENPYDLLLQQRLAPMVDALVAGVKDVLQSHVGGGAAGGDVGGDDRGGAAVESIEGDLSAKGRAQVSQRRSARRASMDVVTGDDAEAKLAAVVGGSKAVLQAMKLVKESALDSTNSEDAFVAHAHGAADAVVTLIAAANGLKFSDHAANLRRLSVAAINSAKTACGQVDPMFHNQMDQAMSLLSAEIRALVLSCKAIQTGELAKEVVNTEDALAAAEASETQAILGDNFQRLQELALAQSKGNSSAAISHVDLSASTVPEVEGEGGPAVVSSEVDDLRDKLGQSLDLALDAAAPDEPETVASSEYSPRGGAGRGKLPQRKSAMLRPLIDSAFGSLPRSGAGLSSGSDSIGRSNAELGRDVDALELADHFSAYFAHARATTVFDFRRSFELPGGEATLTNPALAAVAGSRPLVFAPSGDDVHFTAESGEEDSTSADSSGAFAKLGGQLRDNKRLRAREVMLTALACSLANVELIVCCSEATAIPKRNSKYLHRAAGTCLVNMCRTLLLCAFVLKLNDSDGRSPLDEKSSGQLDGMLKQALEKVVMQDGRGHVDQDTIQAANEETQSSSLVLRDTERRVVSYTSIIRVLTGQLVDALSHVAFRETQLMEAGNDQLSSLMIFITITILQTCDELSVLLNCVETARYLGMLRKQKRSTMIEKKFSARTLQLGAKPLWEECPQKSQGHIQRGVHIKRRGTLNELVTYATSLSVDHPFIRTFVATYRGFATAEEIFDGLVQRYRGPVDGATDFSATQTAIQVRVAIFLKYWIENSFEEFSDELLARMGVFLSRDLSKTHKDLSDSLGQMLSQHVLDHGWEDGGLGDDLAVGLMIPSISLSYRETARGSMFGSGRVSLPVDLQDGEQNADHCGTDPGMLGTHPAFFVLTNAPAVVARQLTLLDFELFSRIGTAELLGQAWTKPKLTYRAPHVIAMIHGANSVSHWVATVILLQKELSARIKAVEFFIEVARNLRKLANFHGLMSLISALNMSPIARLKATFRGVSDQSRDQLQRLESLMSPSASYRTYRETLATAALPYIPFVGTLLSDMTFIDEGNVDTFGDGGEINFAKRDLEFSVLSQLQRAQQSFYSFPPLEPIRSWLATRVHLLEEELYAMSLERESRKDTQAAAPPLQEPSPTVSPGKTSSSRKRFHTFRRMTTKQPLSQKRGSNIG